MPLTKRSKLAEGFAAGMRGSELKLVLQEFVVGEMVEAREGGLERERERKRERAERK